MKVKKVERGDVEEIISLAKKTPQLWASPEIKFYSKGHVLDAIKSDKYIVLKAVDDEGSLLGFVLGEIIYDSLLIIFLAVKPKFRNKNIGTKLMEAAVKEANKKGFYFTYCYVNPEFKKSIGFWKKKGFRKGNKFVFMYREV